MNISLSEFLKNQEPDLIHPLFEVLLELMANSDSRKKLIILPKRHDVAAWTSMWYAALKHYNQRKDNNFKSLSFEKGQKLLVNDIICKFKSIDHESESITLLVRYPKGSEGLYAMPLSKVFKLHKVNQETPLTITASLIKEESSAGNRFISNGVSDIHTAIITTLNYFSDAYEKIKQYNLITCAKLDTGGEILSLDNRTKIDILPSCLLASDIYRFYNFLELDGILPKHILIDGSKHVMDDPSQFKELILEQDIPTTVIIDHSEYASIRVFKELGFDVIKEKQWRNKLRLTQTKALDHINYMFRTVDSLHIEPIVFKNDNLSESFQLLKESTSLKKLGEKMEELYSGALFDLYQVSMSINPTELSPNNKVNDLKRLFSGNQAFTNLIAALELLEREKQRQLRTNEKINHLKALLQTYPAAKTAIVVKNDYELKKCKEYWNEYFKSNKMENVEIVTPRFFQTGFKKYERIFVTGYLGYKRINQVIRSYSCKDIAFLLWEHEMEYYFKAYFHRINKDLSQSYTWEKEENITQVTPTQEEIKEIKQLEPDRIEFNYYNRNINKHFLTKDESLAEKAYLLEFEGGYQAFFTPTYPLYKLASFQEGSEDPDIDPISEVTAPILKEGDQVIYIKSCSERIKEIVDEQLEHHNLPLRETAELWRTALRLKYEEKNRNLGELCKILKQHGLKRNKVTVKNWLTKKEMIGPANINDINIIAEATGYVPLKKKIEEVKAAIGNLRSAHIQASHVLAKLAFQEISAYYNEAACDLESGTSKGLHQYLVVKRVVEGTFKVKRSFVNKIFEMK